MAELPRDVTEAARELGIRLKDGPRTLNELTDWWNKERKGEPSALREAIKWLIKTDLVEPRNLGKTKLLALAGEHHKPAKGSPIVSRFETHELGAKPGAVPPRPAPLADLNKGAAAAQRDLVDKARALGVELEPENKCRHRLPGKSCVVCFPPPAEKPSAAPAPPPAPAAPLAPRSAPEPSAAPRAEGDKPALPAPPADVRGPGSPSSGGAGSSPIGPEWITGREAGEILGMTPSGVQQLRQRSPALMRSRQLAKGGSKAPYLYHREDVAKAAAAPPAPGGRRQRKPPYVVVHTTAGAQPGGGGSGVGIVVLADDDRAAALRLASRHEGALFGVETSRPELAEHQRQVAAAGVPHIVIPPGVVEEIPEWRYKRLAGVPPLEVDHAGGAAAAEHLAALRAVEPRFVHLELGDEARALLERMRATGYYGETIEAIAEDLLLAAMRREVGVLAAIAKVRR